jgi:hypothetical protein
MNPQVFIIWGFFIFNMEHKKTTTKKVMVFGAGGGTSRKCSG